VIQKTIVLTGASRGPGLALAQHLAQEGHIVETGSRSAPPDENAKRGFGVTYVDISQVDQVTAWAETLNHSRRIPDILICNAGVINHPAPLWKISAAELRQVIEINVLGTAYTLRAFAPAMIARGRGIIIVLSSGWGRTVDAEMGPYCASKWALEGLALTLAKELPAGMAVITLNPGIVQTDMLEKCWPCRGQNYELPDSWAKRAAALILNLSSKDNGHQLSVPTGQIKS